MICPFEILHYLPIALIAFSALSLIYSSQKVYISMAIIVASFLGLIAGQHMHTEHMEPLSFFDPCYGYIASLMVSTVALIRKLKVNSKASAR